MGGTTQEVRVEHVLVPLDGSDLAAGALPTARALADRLGAEVQVVAVADDAEDAEHLRNHATGVLGGGAAADRRVQVVVGDDPAAAIRSRAGDLGAAVVCMSSHGRGRVAGTVVGSVTRAVLEAGHQPVVVVGPRVSRPDPYRPVAPLAAGDVVACVDGGPTSERVVPVAAAWARALGTGLTVATVAEPTPAPVLPEGGWHRHHGPDADADAYLRQLVERWTATSGPLHAEVVYNPIGVGPGIEALVDRDPTVLLAVTTHARSGLGRIVVGSGAAAVVRSATVPVLVVPVDAG